MIPIALLSKVGSLKSLLTPKNIKMILIFGGAIFIIWKVKRYFDRQKIVEETSKISEDTTFERAYKIAMYVAKKLGTNYSWWNPASWSEDEKDVINILSFNSDLFQEVAIQYEEITDRYLLEDLENYMSAEQFMKINF